ncbi:hypothetical protein AB1Y20_023714 [Prymnesium parvum]|uniref:Amino acid transporter transmembrane domain-containing protein n=1 Tax=Prymnesium parvum TaxID=97485 RepID=A0AB34JEG8_PRYPA
MPLRLTRPSAFRRTPILLVCCSCALAWAAPQPRPPLPSARPSPLPPLPRTTAATLAALPAEPPKGTSAASMTVNLAKNIVGSGVLALAAGVSTFSSAKPAVAPALALLLFFAGVSAYSFSLIARLGEECGTPTYRDTWASIFGERTAFIPAATITFKTVVGALSYAIIIGDSLASIASLCGGPALLCRSNAWIVIVSVLVLLPLCLLRDLSSLAIGSYLGTGGTLFTAFFMWTRLLQRAYAPGGRFHAAIAPALRPRFDPTSSLLNPKAFVLVSMLATAFLAHYNAPKMYKELAPPADGSSKATRFNLVVCGAFSIAALLCSAIMTAGYLTFGRASQGLILNNYATADGLAFIARIGIGLSIIFSYPLNFVGLREGVLSLFHASDKAWRTDVHVGSTVLLMLAVNGLALRVKNLGLVVSLGGAILGSALVYIIPALMSVAHSQRKAAAARAKGEQLPLSVAIETAAAACLAALGVFLAAVGAVMSLKNAGGH